MAPQRKRPWYLVLALLGGLALGSTGALEGWAKITFFRVPIDPALAVQGISDQADRAAVQARFEAVVRTVDATKSRGWPLAVAALLLGSAIVLLTMRAMGGSRGGRSALVQLLAAQAGLTVASFWLLREVVDANVRLFDAERVVMIHESTLEQHQAEEAMDVTARIGPVLTPVFLALRTLGSILVIVGLTRRRSREFFDASSAALEER